MPQRKIWTRSNFKSSDTTPSFEPGHGVVFVGRLSKEKGLQDLLLIWELSKSYPKLTIVGDGPLRNIVIDATKKCSNIVWVGQKTQKDVADIIRANAFAIVPSTWAEPFGRVAIEAMSVGTPVICTGGGSLEEIVGDTGIALKTLDKESLDRALSMLHSVEDMVRLRKHAYSRFQNNYTGSKAAKDLVAYLDEIEP